MTNLKMPYDADELRRLYEYTSSGHFFDKDTMRFFASRLCASQFKRVNDKEAYFLTSEKACFNDTRRVYTIRKASIVEKPSGHSVFEIDTVGDFARLTRSQALKFFKE